MTYTLAKNMVETSKPFYQYSNGLNDSSLSGGDPNLFNICELFHFNYGIVRELAACVTNRKWVLSVVHGYCKQISTSLIR